MHYLSYEAINNPFYDLHCLLSLLEASLVASVQIITIAHVKADTNTLLPVSSDLAIINNCSSKIEDNCGPNLVCKAEDIRQLVVML